MTNVLVHYLIDSCFKTYIDVLRYVLWRVELTLRENGG